MVSIPLVGTLDNLVDLHLLLATNNSVFTSEILDATPFDGGSYILAALQVEVEDHQVADYSHLHKPLGLEGVYTLLANCGANGRTYGQPEPEGWVLGPATTPAMLMLQYAQHYYLKLESDCSHIWFESLDIDPVKRTIMFEMGS